MLATGLLILKIIGFILLGILGLLLAVILAILLVPIRYRAKASYFGEAKGEASVSWLLHILSCKAVYDGDLNMAVRVFGFKIGGRDEPEDADMEDDRQNAKRQDTKQREVKEKTEPQPESRPQSAPSPQSDPRPEPGPTPKPEEEDLEKELERELREEAAREQMSSQPQKHGKKKISFSFQKICDKLKEIVRKKEELEGLVKDEENRELARLLWRQLKRLLRHILPQKASGKVRFGFDDPYTTGQILTYLSPFYGLYGRRLTLIPVFEEPVLEGEAALKGRIRIGTVLVTGARMLMNKRFRTCLKKWRE